MNHSDTPRQRSDLKVYELPYSELEKLSSLLDENNSWISLAKKVNYSDEKIQDIIRFVAKNNGSAAKELLIRLGDQNLTVIQLFGCLAKLQLSSATESIMHLVDSRYHAWLPPETPKLSAFMSSPSVSAPQINGRNDTVKNTADNATTADIAHSLKNVAGSIPQIDYDELEEATEAWNNKNILGRGGFGIVFKGSWKNTRVAIKRIEPKRKDSDLDIDFKLELQQSMNELKFLSGCRHDNILPLYGYSVNGDKPCLIYQLMTGGSLEKHLFDDSNGKAKLNWVQKLDIALGTARGLQYLHTFTSRPVIHGDIKPHNILLDQCLQPKIGDFGLVRETTRDPVKVSRIFGTKPYLPPEFLLQGCLSTKVDTYSFGVVLYEMATERRAFVKARRPHEHLTRIVEGWFTGQIQGPNVVSAALLPIEGISLVIFTSMIQLGQNCTKGDPKARPEMVEALKMLEKTESDIGKAESGPIMESVSSDELPVVINDMS